MQRHRFLGWLSKVQVIVLSLCLLTTVGRAWATDSQGARGPVSVTSSSSRPTSKLAEPLSSQELQELSSRTEKPGPDVVGGSLSNQHLTYIVIALAAAVIVLIAK